MSNSRDGTIEFAAGLKLRARGAEASDLRRTLVRFPAMAALVTGNRELGLALVALQVAVVLAIRHFGMARQAKELAAERLEALRLQRPSWLQPAVKVRSDGPASPAADRPTAPEPRGGADPHSPPEARRS